MKVPLAIWISLGLALSAAAAPAPRLNVVFFTADDMNHDSAGCYGCPIRDLTPNLDKLASEGLRFERAYSTVAVCQPVRQTMLTGLYPHRSGSMGFFPVKPGVRTLNQQFRDAGYLISLIGKNPHYQPRGQFCADFEETRVSRDPAQLAEVTKKFAALARAQGKPFLHLVNCTDPHRPFIGAGGPNDFAHGSKPGRVVKPEEVRGVPGFLEDLPEIRREVAQYYTSVGRLDECVGAVLRAIDELGLRDSTLVLFYGGDHGMSFPFAKSNDYEDSSRASFILRWPGVIEPGRVDRDHLVSTVDFTPTLLEAAGLPPIPGVDGRSFLPALKGGKMAGWDRVYTFYNQTSGRNWFPMRCVRTKDRAYIWNAWSDGTTAYRAENMNGLTWPAMLAAAKTNPEIKARTDFYLRRVPEEFYDLTADRYERRNLEKDPARQADVDALRRDLLDFMRRTGDPLAEAFAKRGDRAAVTDALRKLDEEFSGVPKKKKARAAGQAGAKAVREDSRPVAEKPQLEFVLPAVVKAGQPVTLKIRHRLPASMEEEALTVTLKEADGNGRLDRQTVNTRGDGPAEVTLNVPASARGKKVRFAAFVGEDFSKTPCHIVSEPVNVAE